MNSRREPTRTNTTYCSEPSDSYPLYDAETTPHASSFFQRRYEAVL